MERRWNLDNPTAKPPALLERLTAVQHLPEKPRRISKGNRYSHKEILMTQRRHLNHATWDCKYHMILITEIPEESDLREDQETSSAPCSTIWPGAANAGSKRGI